MNLGGKLTLSAGPSHSLRSWSPPARFLASSTPDVQCRDNDPSREGERPMTPPRAARLALSCRLCKHRATFPVLDGVRADMTEEDARTDVVGRIIRAENDFFRDHWQRKHPVEAAEVTQHIALVTRLARVTTYHKRVLESRFNGLPEPTTPM
jgi:hypothetical protein